MRRPAGLIDGGVSGDGHVNDGSITAITPGYFHAISYQGVNGDSVTNNGTISVGGGEIFWVDDSNCTNTGDVAVCTLVLNDSTIDGSGKILLDWPLA